MVVRFWICMTASNTGQQKYRLLGFTAMVACWASSSPDVATHSAAAQRALARVSLRPDLIDFTVVGMFHVHSCIAATPEFRSSQLRTTRHSGATTSACH